MLWLLLGLVQSVRDVLYAVLHLFRSHVQKLRGAGVLDQLGRFSLLLAFIDVGSFDAGLFLTLNSQGLRFFEDLLHPRAVIFLACIVIKYL